MTIALEFARPLGLKRPVLGLRGKKERRRSSNADAVNSKVDDR